MGDAVSRSLARLPYRPALLAAEPGRFLVAESSVLVATVIGTARRAGERWAYLDVGGFNGLMEAIQTGGRWLFPIRTSRADDAIAPTASFNITGPSCDSSDTMFYGVELPETLERGRPPLHRLRRRLHAQLRLELQRLSASDTDLRLGTGHVRNTCRHQRGGGLRRGIGVAEDRVTAGRYARPPPAGRPHPDEPRLPGRHRARPARASC